MCHQILTTRTNAIVMQSVKRINVERALSAGAQNSTCIKPKNPSRVMQFALARSSLMQGIDKSLSFETII